MKVKVGETYVEFYVMDARARYDPDSAVVHTVCTTVREARKDQRMFGESVIIPATIRKTKGRNKPDEIVSFGEPVE